MKRKSSQHNKSAYSHHTQTKQKAVKKNYIVTPQTAYHIQELALQEKTTEGRIIDKIMRSYLCNRATIYQNSK